MAKSNTKLYDFARSHLGEGGAKFRRYCGLPSNAAWCAAFVTYVFHESGYDALMADEDVADMIAELESFGL